MTGSVRVTTKRRRLFSRQSAGDRIFGIVNALLLAAVSLSTLLPVLSVIISTLTPTADLRAQAGAFIAIPSRITFSHFVWLFKGSSKLLDAYVITILRTLCGTALNLLVTVLTAYPLSKKYLPGRRAVMLMFLFTMLFSGGMIPTFLVVQSVKLIDSFWAMVLPCALNVYNMILMRTFFQSIPEELDESARIDGANDIVTLFRVILPVALPAIASIGLFYAVFHWNSFIDAVLYIRSRSLWPLQQLLREILVTNDVGELALGGSIQDPLRPPSSVIINCMIVVSAIPIMCVYPFLQRYFVKGLMIGSVKG